MGIDNIFPGSVIEFMETSITYVHAGPGLLGYDVPTRQLLPKRKQILLIVATAGRRNGCLNCFVISPCNIIGWIWINNAEIKCVIK